MKGLSLSDTYKAEVGDARVHAVCSLWIELFDTRLDRQRVARAQIRLAWDKVNIVEDNAQQVILNANTLWHNAEKSSMVQYAISTPEMAPLVDK